MVGSECNTSCRIAVILIAFMSLLYLPSNFLAIPIQFNPAQLKAHVTITMSGVEKMDNQGWGPPPNIVEFRAGKMTMRGTMVYPDTRKGLVYVYLGDDLLTHFCWKDRASGRVEDDLIIFPEDTEFIKVTQCKPGSRVVLLKFKTSSRRMFFWMQEPKADKDEELIERVNEALNNCLGP